MILETEIEKILSQLRTKEIDGLNVTVPFKNKVIPFVDSLTEEASETMSVNTIYLKNEKIWGHNTDIAGFELGIRSYGYDVKNKNVFIFGAGGVTPSIIVALKRMQVSKIFLYNRTISKSEMIKEKFKDIEIIDKNNVPNEVDMLVTQLV